MGAQLTVLIERGLIANHVTVESIHGIRMLLKAK